ncbi:MAG: chemotaxis protein CheA [Lachnospiraceae bacterium]|nr:chemotaxis protein CheA [Lachnospiraceae bacterium]
MDVSQYLEIFIDETKEHLQSLNEQLLVLEKEPENADTINEIFRAAHSLKGMAGTMGYKIMQEVTHKWEDVFSEVRNGKMKVTPDLVDVLFKGLDKLETILDNIINAGNEGDDKCEELIAQLIGFVNGGGAAPAAAAPAAAPKKKAPAKTAAPAEPAAVATETKSEDSSKEKFRQFKYADFEQHAINKAIDEGTNAFGITVYIQESCLLKAARAFMVFKKLEEMGTIAKSEPAVQDIEDERFDLDFSMVFLTKEGADRVKQAIMNVSEVECAYVSALSKDEVESATIKEESAQTDSGAADATATATENKPTATQNAAATAGKPVVNRSVRVDIEKLDDLMNLVSELIIAKNGLVSLNAQQDEVNHAVGNAMGPQIEYLERITTNLHQSVMKVRMVPLESVFNRFPRMIRDVSKSLNKKINLVISGEETELDRTVIDEIGDPLTHLLRNAADHGIETAEERAKTNKPEVGTINLNAYQEGNNVVIEVKDDGNGIDVEKVKRKAIEKGTISKEQSEVMTDKEIIDLLFKPSFSTAEKVSELSGRGVGLDVVKTNIEKLGGDVEVRTVLGGGSNFIVRLPLTLAIIQSLMVEIGTEKYAIPLGSIQTIEDIPVSDLKYVQSREVIHLRGSVIPIIRLNQILDIESTKGADDNLTVVIVSKGDKLAGFVVDNLIGQQEIVIKSIGKYIESPKMISGATILGDGEVALILDVNTLV